MERREKGVERDKKSEGLMVEKLKIGCVVGKRRDPSTPPPTWRLEFPSHSSTKNQVQEFLNFPTSALSARNLCAKLWEIQPHQLAPLAKMRTSLRRRHVHHCRDTIYEPAAARGLRRHVKESPVQHHRSVERNNCALQNVSPASYTSSVEVRPYNHVIVNPTSSSDFKGRVGESSCNPKTSRELLKVLDRIWCLEEQHASDKATVKALKMEVDLSRARVKDLLQEKKINKQAMEKLIKKLTEDKLVRKSNEHVKIKAAVQSIKEKIQDEKRLRKHSESLHRKLARELSEVKSSFCSSLRDLESERKARIVLENLCDDFAKGTRDYEHEVHSLMHNVEKGQVKGDCRLRISEAWLNERKQMKLVQASSDLTDRDSIIDKLGVDIETYLLAKSSVNLRRCGNSSTKELKEIYPYLDSLDSFPLKETISAPHNTVGEDSIGTDIFDLKRTADEEGLDKLSHRLHSNNNANVRKEKKGSHSSMKKQVQPKEIILLTITDKNMSCDENERVFVERKSSEIGGNRSTILLNAPPGVSAIQGPPESDRTWTKRIHSGHMLDNLVGNSSLSSEGDKVFPESICREESCVHSAVMGNSSPVKQWKPILVVSDFNQYESSPKLHRREVKDNKLMAKLLEARLEEQRCRSKANKSSFCSADESIGL